MLTGWNLALGMAFTVAVQGVSRLDVKPAAAVYFGSPAATSKPASIERRKVESATPEFREMRREGVRRGSARHSLLTTRMERRIRDVKREVIRGAGYDCVVARDDIRDPGEQVVADLTNLVRDAVRESASRSVGPGDRGTEPGADSTWTVVLILAAVGAIGLLILVFRRR